MKSAREKATGESNLNLDACSSFNDELKIYFANLKLLQDFMESCLKLHDGSPYDIEISPLTFSTCKWTGFQMMVTFAMKELKFHEVLEEVIH